MLRLNKKRLFILLSIFFTNCPNHSSIPKGTFIPSKYLKTPFDPNVLWGQLNNGLIYALVNNTEPKEKISMRLYVHAGSLMETDRERGVAHFLEHMGFNGSKHFPEANQIVTDLQKIGVAFGRDNNAYTSFDETVYQLDLPNTQPETIDTGMKVLLDYAGFIKNSEESIQSEKGIVLAEMRDRSRPRLTILTNLFRTAVPGLNYYQRLPIGTKETIHSFDSNLVNGFYRKWYRPDRMVLTLVGDIDPLKLEKKVKTYFNQLKKHQEHMPSQDNGSFTPNGKLSAVVISHPEVSTTEGSYTVTKAENIKPETKKKVKKEIMIELISKIASERIFQSLEENSNSPILSGYLSISHYLNFSFSSVLFKIKPHREKEVIAYTENFIREFKKYPPRETELNQAKKSYLSDLEKAVEMSSRIPNSVIADQLYSFVRDKKNYRTPEQNLKYKKKILNAISTKNLHRLFNSSFNDPESLKSQHQIAITGKELKTTQEELLKYFEKASSVEIVQKEEKKAKKWAYDKRPNGKEIQYRKEKLDLDIIALSFENKVKASLLQRSSKKNEILLELTIRGPNSTAKSPVFPPKTGIREGFSAVFNDSGLKLHNPVELKEILVGKKLFFDIKADADEIRFYGSTGPTDLEFIFQLIRAWITEPAFEQKAFERYKIMTKEDLKVEGKNTQALLIKKLKQLASGQYPYLRPLEEKEINQLEWQDIVYFYQPILQKGSIEFSIVGDFDFKKSEKLIRDYLGTLPERDSVNITPDLTAPEALTPFKSIAKGDFRVLSKEKEEKTIIIYIIPTDGVANPQTNLGASLLTDALSDMLRVEIREKLGSSYSPSAFQNNRLRFKNRNYTLAFISIDPKREKETISVVKSIFKKLAQGKISEDLFERIKKPYLSALKTKLDDNNYWIQEVTANCFSRPQKIEWAKTAESRLQAISREDVIQLGKHYFENVKYTQIIATSRH